MPADRSLTGVDKRAFKEQSISVIRVLDGHSNGENGADSVAPDEDWNLWVFMPQSPEYNRTYAYL